MSEPFDKYVKLRERERLSLVRDAVSDYVNKGHEPCRSEFVAALAAFGVFEMSAGAEADWQALEDSLAALQRCTEA